MNPKSQSVKLNSKQYHFLVSFQQKSMTQFFFLKKKPHFGIFFAQREIFQIFQLSTTALVSQHYLNVKYTEKTGHQTKNYQHAKVIQQVCTIHEIICEIHLI